jgi:hypothetical protein
MIVGANTCFTMPSCEPHHARKHCDKNSVQGALVLPAVGSEGGSSEYTLQDNVGARMCNHGSPEHSMKWNVDVHIPIKQTGRLVSAWSVSHPYTHSIRQTCHTQEVCTVHKCKPMSWFAQMGAPGPTHFRTIWPLKLGCMTCAG